MKATKVVAVLTLIAAGAAFALHSPAVSEAGGKDVKPMVIHLKSVRVSETNKDGQAWDINNGKPDLVVKIKNDSDSNVKEFTSSEKTDVFEATWDVATIPFLKNQKVTITVWDKDVASDDLIGRKQIEITEDMIAKGRAELSFDQVKSLIIEFKKQ
jgi:hypothetical protein